MDPRVFVGVGVGGEGGVQAQLPERTALTTFFWVFSPQHILQRVSNSYFKENYNFPRFQRGPAFSRDGATFPERGSNLLILIENYRT